MGGRVSEARNRPKKISLRSLARSGIRGISVPKSVIMIIRLDLETVAGGLLRCNVVGHACCAVVETQTGRYRYCWFNC